MFCKIFNEVIKSKYSIAVIIAFLFALFARGFPQISRVYVLSPIILLMSVIVGMTFIRSNTDFKNIFVLVLIFTLWSMLTSIWSDYPIFTLKRSILFFIVGFGSLVLGNIFSEKRDLILTLFLGLNILIVVSALFSLISGLPNNSWSGGHGLGFLGFTNHQNKLGQYIYLSSAPLILFFGRRLSNRNSVYIYILLFLNLMFLTLSVSRASILALFISWIIYFIMSYGLPKSILFIIIFIGVISSVIYVTSSFDKGSKITLVKNEKNFGERRYKTIIDSWEAAKKGGILGQGYGISDIRFKDPILGYYDDTSEGQIYRREKTISILAIVEEAGIIGFIIFLTIIIYPIIILVKKLELSKFSVLSISRKPEPDYYRRYLVFTFSFLISLNVYAQIESWWIGLGSAVLPLYFIFSGAVMGVAKN